MWFFKKNVLFLKDAEPAAQGPERHSWWGRQKRAQDQPALAESSLWEDDVELCLYYTSFENFFSFFLSLSLSLVVVVVVVEVEVVVVHDAKGKERQIQ